ncbi:MAG: hypothetical protein ACRD26_20445 [Vicinamibacterales bacterium]
MILVLIVLLATPHGLVSLGTPGGVALRTLDGRTVDPFAGRQRATAFVFVHADCPVTSRYAPELNRLFDEAASRIRVWLVYPGRDEDETAIQAHYREHGLRAPALRDPGFRLADRAGATITPEAAVFARTATGPRLVYRGRIDDRAVRPGVWRPVAGARDLAAVLDRLGRGEDVTPLTTQAVGCYIRPLS